MNRKPNEKEKKIQKKENIWAMGIKWIAVDWAVCVCVYFYVAVEPKRMCNQIIMCQTRDE